MTVTALIQAAVPEFLGGLAAAAVFAIGLGAFRRGRAAITARRRGNAADHNVP